MESYSFLHHGFSDAERLWLQMAATEEPFDARAARARLHAKLPKDFRPQKIDERFYRNNALTLLGVRVFRPDDRILKVMEDVIYALRARIVADPTLDSVSLRDISELVKETEEVTRTAIQLLSDLGSFFSGISKGSREEIDRVWFNGPRGYDGVLEFESLDTLLQEWYVARRSIFELIGDDSEFPVVKRFATPKGESSSTKRDTAFVIMPIDPSKPELEDVLGAIKEGCAVFGIRAYRADEIEHQDRITNVILDEIRRCDILIADLSHERPNVYYEIGYAHALNKKPILYRRLGTPLHFDLSVHNVPEYRNITELRDMLRRRLEAVMGRAPSAA